MRKFAVVFAFAACLAVFPSSAFGQATRTWVSGVGDDANPCSRTAPCKTWAGAISKTFIGGEIDALDPGAYGALIITKSVTIDGGESFAGTLSGPTAFGMAVNIPAGNPNDPHRRVVLRNLSLNGTGASGTVGTNVGVNGIRIDAATAVHVQNVRIANFAQNGIDFTPTAAGDMSLFLDGVDVRQNSGNGLLVGAFDATQQLDVMVRDSTIAGSRGTFGTAPDTGIGVLADTGARIWLTGTTVFDNVIGLKTYNRKAGTEGVINSFCDNQIAGNGADGVAPNRLCPDPPVVTNTVTNNVITPAPPAPAPVVITKTAPVECIVPNLKGLTVSVAKRMLAATNCALGKVTKKKATKRKQVGTVIAQKTVAGKRLAKGAKIAVTVGRA
jgi:hypothetical protein